MRFTIAVLLIAIGLLSSVSGNIITGIVVNTENEPLSSVSIVSNSSGVGGITDLDGTFLIALTDEVTRLTFSSVGYHPAQYKIDNLPEPIVLKQLYYDAGDILISADRSEIGKSSVPLANISSDDIAREYSVGEFPLLLESTPNVYAFTDGGSTLGYAYLSVRGFSDQRIATYINGVPLNDPEDHATYFVDLPDFASTATDIQVQRGVGNALYGDASFGGSINVVTNSLSQSRKTTLTSGYGEYTSDGKSISDIYRQSLEFSSGLINGRYHFGGRFSKQKTGGFRHHSWYNGWAYYFSAARIDPNMTTEVHLYGGPIQMHLSYYGATLDEISADRRVNRLTYDNETDNFNQPHYQLHNRIELNDRMTLTNTLYYIRGKGYYEQLKRGQNLTQYNIDPSLVDTIPGTNLPYSDGDLVRQKWVFKNQIGWNPRLDIEHDRGQHTLGGSFYYFDSEHWGNVVWAQHIGGDLPPRNRYYEHFGRKMVGSLFAEEKYRLTDKLTTQLTAQLRWLDFDFDQTQIGAFEGYDYDLSYLFFSPRAGLVYAVDQSTSVYANIAISSRAPNDDNFYDADDPDKVPQLELVSAAGVTPVVFGDPLVSSERLLDIEFGFSHRKRRWQASVNLFWMRFTDQNLFEGGVDDAGRYITVAVDRSEIKGIELAATYLPVSHLTLEADFSYNHGRIKEYASELVVYDASWNFQKRTVDLAGKTITGMPEYIGNGRVSYETNRMLISAKVRFVGRQFVELHNIDSLAIDPHVTVGLSSRYRLPELFGIGDLILSARIDNLFDQQYIASGYGWNYGMVDDFADPVTVISEGEYYVASERSFYAQVALELF
ncbi:MAG: TonB-dependent receptor [candidate division Zixibacteria bacterium]